MMSLTDEKKCFADQLVPFESATLPIRGRFCRLDKTLSDILTSHAYPDVVSHALAEAAALTALLGSLLKFDGIFTLQLKGDGPVSMLVCDMTSEGAIRATAQFDADKLPDYHPGLSPKEIFGKGYIAFTIDQGPQTERYQGIVELQPDSLTASAQQYFDQSEQIDTFITLSVGRLTVGDQAERFCASGLLLQRMPEQDAGRLNRDLIGDEEEDGWKRMSLFAKSAQQDEMLDLSLPEHDLLYRLFQEDGVRVAENRALFHACRCSEDKIKNVLSQFKPEDLTDMLTDDGDISALCQFCGYDYRFKLTDLSVPKQ